MRQEQTNKTIEQGHVCEYVRICEYCMYDGDDIQGHLPCPECGRKEELVYYCSYLVELYLNGNLTDFKERILVSPLGVRMCARSQLFGVRKAVNKLLKEVSK